MKAGPPNPNWSQLATTKGAPPAAPVRAKQAGVAGLQRDEKPAEKKREELSADDQAWGEQLMTLANDGKRSIEDRSVAVVESVLSRFHSRDLVQGVKHDARVPYPYASVESDVVTILVGKSWLQMMLGGSFGAASLKSDVDAAVKSIGNRKILAKANDPRLDFEGRVKATARQLLEEYLNDGVAVQQILFQADLAAPTAEVASNGDVVLKVGKSFLEPGPLTENIEDYLPACRKELGPLLQQILGKKLEWALLEGPKGSLANLGFGRVCAFEPGKEDFDSRDWTRTDSTISPKASPWTAVSNMVTNVRNDSDVPRADGSLTKWSFDCAEAAIVLHIYAQWRTLTRAAFDKRFADLKIGGQSPNDLFDNSTFVYASNPEMKPTKALAEDRKRQVGPDQWVIEHEEEVGKSWDTLLDEAPVGSQVVFQNWDANRKCNKDGTLHFCKSWVFENTIKLGKDQYFAFGTDGVVANEETIKREMAEIVLAPRKPTADYIKKNLHVSGIRFPKLKP